MVYNKQFDYFHFRATQGLEPLSVHYQSRKKKTSKVVFQAYHHKKQPEVVLYYRHNAFQSRFRREGNEWYLEVNPTYHYTKNGDKVYLHREEQLTGIKRLERNSDVCGQLVMWANYMSKPADLFTAPEADSLITFGELQTFQIEASIDDGSRVKHEEMNADETGINLDQLEIGL